MKNCDILTFIFELGQSTETDTIPFCHGKEDAREGSGYQFDFSDDSMLASRLCQQSSLSPFGVPA